MEDDNDGYLFSIVERYKKSMSFVKCPISNLWKWLEALYNALMIPSKGETVCRAVELYLVVDMASLFTLMHTNTE